MLKLLFYGFRHGHINGLYQKATKSDDFSVVGCIEENAEARARAEKALDIVFSETSYDEWLKSDVDAVAIGLATELCREFAAGEYDRVGIVCTKYRSMMLQEAEVRFLLPLEEKAADSLAGTVFEPDELTVLNEIVPEYVAGILVSAVRESFACEVAARRTAMDSAGKNAQQMIDGLQLAYNRARQSAITQEITEIVAGSGS